jgi:DNA polymerase III delta prime subunit
LDALVKVSDGDLRQAITLLQTAKRLCVSSGVTPNDIYEMTGVIDLLINRLFLMPLLMDYFRLGKRDLLIEFKSN